MLTLILGPMCSGKSLEIVQTFSKFKYAEKNFVILQPVANVRDKQLTSRQGISLPCVKIESLAELEKYSLLEYIGIDEIHMFEKSNIKEAREAVKPILKLLNKGRKFYISGLDLNYQGQLFNVIKALIELGPTEIMMKSSVCVCCQNMDATYSQILSNDGQPVTRGLSSISPDDGTFMYEPRCRRCFVFPK